MKTLADLDRIIEVRATRFVRLHVAGRGQFKSWRERSRHASKCSRAIDRLIEAVRQRDRELVRMQARLAALGSPAHRRARRSVRP